MILKKSLKYKYRNLNTFNLLKNIEDILKPITNDFIFDYVYVKFLKIYEAKDTSSFRMIKTFGIFEESFKAILTNILKNNIPKHLDEKAIYNIDRTPINFKNYSGFISSLKGWISKDEFKNFINKMNIDEKWFLVKWTTVGNLYKNRNDAVHSAKFDICNPYNWMKSLVFLISIFDHLSCNNKDNSKYRRRNNNFEIEFHEEVIGDFFEDEDLDFFKKMGWEVVSDD